MIGDRRRTGTGSSASCQPGRMTRQRMLLTPSTALVATPTHTVVLYTMTQDIRPIICSSQPAPINFAAYIYLTMMQAIYSVRSVKLYFFIATIKFLLLLTDSVLAALQYYIPTVQVYTVDYIL